MSLKVTLDSGLPRLSRLRRANMEEVKEYLEGLSFRELIEDYALQTNDNKAVEDLREILIEWILEYYIHQDLYPDKLMVRR